tara:strand:+ start:26551 stop:26898 length:348 start_codon:yes stop_codon:yes gene_type:complete
MLRPPKPVGHVEIEDKKYILSLGSYMNGRTAVMLHTNSGEPFAVVSKNIPSVDIDDGEFFVGWYDLTPQILTGLDECGFFEDTGSRIRPADSHVELPLWKMKDIIANACFQIIEE